jgi:hypothetical protein
MSEEDKHGANVVLQQRERVHHVHIAAP